jgi:hypothetical protein
LTEGSTKKLAAEEKKATANSKRKGRKGTQSGEKGEGKKLCSG